MPRKPSADPRSRQFLLRFTERQAEVLEAYAFLERSTPTEIASQVVAGQLLAWAENDRVKRILVERAERDAESAGKLTPLAGRSRPSAG